MPRPSTLLSVAGGLAGLGLAVALFLRFGPDATDASQLRGFTVTSPTSVDVVFEVARPPGTPLLCVLRARDATGAEVGRRELTVPASRARSAVVQETVVTTAPAVTGELVGCRPGTAPPSP